MKIKYILLIVLCLLSFYISDKALLFVEDLSPLMKEIKNKNLNNEIKPVNAIIKNNTIITGIKGKKVNIRESYIKMNEFKEYNETFLIYDYIKPKISIEDNIDKIIIGSNKINDIALITKYPNIAEYLSNKKIPISLIINNKTKYNDNIDYINGNINENKFNNLNRDLTKNDINCKICIIGVNDISLCKKNNYYIVSLTNTINDNNITSINNTKGGSFIMIDNLNESNLNYLINYIKKDNLNIVKLSDLIKE